MAIQKKLSVLLIPPERWQPSRDAYIASLSPAEGMIDLLMAEHHGVNIELLDPNEIPLNPLARLHPVYRGIDPIRAFSVLSKYRSVDLVLSVFESSALLPLLLRGLVGFRPKIAIWDIAPDEEWRARQLIQNLVVPRVDHMFLLSSSQEGYIDQRWGTKNRTSVVWHHIDTEFFRPKKQTLTGPILAIGDDHGRDWPTLLEAVSDMDVDLIVKTKKTLDLTGIRRCRVHQISHRISYPELRGLYANCRFVVLPLKSTLNVSGVGSALESMAMGKALIISDNPPIRDYLAPGDTCCVVPVGDASKMRSAISKFLTQTDLVEQMGIKARLRAEQLYSKPVFAERLARQIRELVELNHVTA